MVVIRLTRTGAKKRPFYHLVVVDSRVARDSGNYIERLGYFNPVAKGAEIRLHLDQERVTHWISKGAQPSDRVATLIKEAKLAESGVSITEKKQAKRDAQKARKAKTAEAAAKKAKAEEEAVAAEAEADKAVEAEQPAAETEAKDTDKAE